MSGPVARKMSGDFPPAHGLTEDELKGAVTHLAFHAGRPKAMSAMGVAKRVLGTTSKEN